ncbi:MAG: glycosyltransferase family 9 protein [Armatimonadetes bacterium]|nr:glycosyltransferase family 9 protein [Armatimonadota bacterium]
MNAPKRILVVRFRAIGDCVMAAWPITSIREKYPDAWIAWATEPACASVIDHQALTQKIMRFPRDKWKRERYSLRTWQDQLNHYLRIRKFKFDVAIDFQGHSKTALLVRLSGAPVRVAVHATDALSQRLNPVPIPRPKDTHWVDHHMKVIRTLDDFADVTLPLMPHSAVPEQLPESKFVTICTGGSSAKKQLSKEQWQAIAAKFVEAGFPVVTVGGPKDPALQMDGVIDRVGAFSLRGSLEAIRASALHVATDTGTGHIAAAVGTPVVSLFGPDELAVARYRPYTKRGVVLRGNGHPSDVDPQLIAESGLGLLC